MLYRRRHFILIKQIRLDEVYSDTGKSPMEMFKMFKSSTEQQTEPNPPKKIKNKKKTQNAASRGNFTKRKPYDRFRANIMGMKF